MKSKAVDSRQSTVGRRTVAAIVFRFTSIASGFNQRGQLSVVRLKSAIPKLCSAIMLKLALVAGLYFMLPSFLLAQSDTSQTHTVDMATTMRSNGKIYVVVTVLVIILVGLFLYLIRLDRKIGKLEKEQ